MNLPRSWLVIKWMTFLPSELLSINADPRGCSVEVAGHQLQSATHYAPPEAPPAEKHLPSQSITN